MSFTVARLTQALEITEEQAATVIGLIRGTVDPFSVPATDAWRRQCYHEPDPKHADTIMHAIDATIGAYGLEPVTGNYVDRYHQDCVACYCNTGDTYTPTILRDNVKGVYRLMSLGDFVERFDRQYGIQ